MNGSCLFLTPAINEKLKRIIAQKKSNLLRLNCTLQDIALNDAKIKKSQKSL